MDTEPLSPVILRKALALGIKKITLEFSGGSDEGSLDVSFDSGNHHLFASEVEDWVWDVYDYSGAGDGNDYGDTVTYDLVKLTVTTSEWSMQRTDGDESEPEPFELAEEEEEDAPEPMTEAALAKLKELTEEINGRFDTHRALQLIEELRNLVDEQ